jgi:hypothetical protein
VRRRTRQSRRGSSLIAALAVAALTIAGCGDDESADETTVAAQPDLERYCELVAELDRNSAAIFTETAEEAEGGIPSNEELAAAQLRVLEENEDLIAEAGVVVPDEIRDDFELSVESARERAEAGDASQPPKEVADAGIRLQEFRRDNCARSK